MSADRPDPSIDEPAGAPSEPSAEDESTHKPRRDPTLLGIPQGQPRRGGWFESGARATDARLQLPENDAVETRSGWNSVADRTGKISTPPTSIAKAHSKPPPPPSESAKKIQPPRTKRTSSNPPPKSSTMEPTNSAIEPTNTEGFAALGDPDAKNERPLSIAPARPSEKLLGLSDAPPSVAEPPEHAPTTIDVSAPELHSSPSEPAAVPEDPRAGEVANTTVDDHPPELAEPFSENATPLAPLPEDATPLVPIVNDQPLDLTQFDDGEATEKSSGAGRKLAFVIGALVVAGVVGAILWRSKSKTEVQPVTVVDKVIVPTDKTGNSSDDSALEKTGNTLDKTGNALDKTGNSSDDSAPQNVGDQDTLASDDVSVEALPEVEREKNGTASERAERSLLEIMQSIEDADVPSQSRNVARMQPAAKLRKARSHLRRATTHFRRKRYDRAIRYYVKAVVFAPEHEEATEGIVRSLRARNEHDKAISWAKRLVQLDSKNALYWSYVGDILRELERPQEARVIYARALRENSKNKAAIAGLKALSAR